MGLRIKNKIQENLISFWPCTDTLTVRRNLTIDGQENEEIAQMESNTAESSPTPSHFHHFRDLKCHFS